MTLTPFPLGSLPVTWIFKVDIQLLHLSSNVTSSMTTNSLLCICTGNYDSFYNNTMSYCIYVTYVLSLLPCCLRVRTVLDLCIPRASTVPCDIGGAHEMFWLTANCQGMPPGAKPAIRWPKAPGTRGRHCSDISQLKHLPSSPFLSNPISFLPTLKVMKQHFRFVLCTPVVPSHSQMVALSKSW